MNHILFPNKAKSVTAALASLLAMTALLVYLAAPSAAKPSMDGAYASAAKPVVAGLVKGSAGKPMRAVKVQLVFRDGKRFVEKVVVLTKRNGRYSVAIPKRAKTLLLTVSKRSHHRTESVHKRFVIRPGESIDVTAVFPKSGSGLMPGLFPY